MRHLSHECRFEAYFRFRFARMQIQRQSLECKCKYKGKCIGKWFLCPKCGIYLLNAALKRDFLDFRMQIQRQNAKAKANAYENGFYALNAAFISWMPLWSVFSQRNALCKCGIYLLNANFSISECKYKGKMQRQMHRKKYKGKCKGFYALNAAFISWIFEAYFSISECKYKGKM